MSVSDEASTDQDPSGVNEFSNDGSFIERFRQLQEKAKQEEDEKKDAKTPSPVAVPRSVPFRLAGVKRRIKPETPGPSSTAAQTEDRSGCGQPHPSAQVSPTPDCHTSAPKKRSRWGVPPPDVVADSPLSSSEAAPPSTASGPVKKKRASRWDAAPTQEETIITQAIESFTKPVTQRLTPDQIRQMMEQQQMDKLTVQVQMAARTHGAAGKKTKYQYDPDEDTADGGTWEHKLRAKEMTETQDKAQELTDNAEGKHFIGDFLPSDELERFMEKARAIKEGRPPDLSDYSSHKLTEDNIGYQLLQKAGWSQGTGLGLNEDGITAPVNKGKLSFDQSGVGESVPNEVTEDDTQFDVYRKRMMLAYRFRPNPLNNPRRPYY